MCLDEESSLVIEALLLIIIFIPGLSILTKKCISSGFLDFITNKTRQVFLLQSLTMFPQKQRQIMTSKFELKISGCYPFVKTNTSYRKADQTGPCF